MNNLNIVASNIVRNY